MQTKQAKLDQIRAEILKKNICPNLAKTAKNLVMGDGNPDADIVFIGEAPGKNEDEQGLPFVGAAGKFLDEMLAMIKLERQDIYITNIVKYRPPNNRDPLPDEKAAFLPYLQQQLVVIKPKLIVTLGRHSMEVFLPGLKISQVHGQPKRFRWNLQRSGDQHADEVQGASEARTEAYQEYAEVAQGLATQQSGSPENLISGVKFAAKTGKSSGSAGSHDSLVLVLLPLFHPAAALYNGGLRTTLIEDFMRIPLILNKLEITNKE